MMRCDKCAVRVEENKPHRVQLVMRVWCPDIRFRKSAFERMDDQVTEFSDLCEACSTALWSRMKELSVEFSCPTIETDVPVEELIGCCVEPSSTE